ncbi:hypothetical protein jhhlp_007445 [Lomentospora prolificans]|uniref:Uncharacterized protein n=1 Tax=Lomentospora prolificans TaxID=41688 RepID=A0A2N3N122_9PEZI|nr:hypothetical protein jhhlp_007445 [Lomentospora prolificans]
MTLGQFCDLNLVRQWSTNWDTTATWLSCLMRMSNFTHDSLTSYRVTFRKRGHERTRGRRADIYLCISPMARNIIATITLFSVPRTHRLQRHSPNSTLWTLTRNFWATIREGKDPSGFAIEQYADGDLVICGREKSDGLASIYSWGPARPEGGVAYMLMFAYEVNV